MVVSWFRLGFRFAFQWPFRVSSSTDRAVHTSAYISWCNIYITTYMHISRIHRDVIYTYITSRCICMYVSYTYITIYMHIYWDVIYVYITSRYIRYIWIHTAMYVLHHDIYADVCVRYIHDDIYAYKSCIVSHAHTSPRICDIYSYVWHESFICVTYLYVFVIHDTYAYISWCIYIYTTRLFCTHAHTECKNTHKRACFGQPRRPRGLSRAGSWIFKSAIAHWFWAAHYRMAKTPRTPYFNRLFSAKEPYD